MICRLPRAALGLSASADWALPAKPYLRSASMERILWNYQPPSLATWAYLSSLLTIAIYFKFSRLLSVRNLDVLALVALAPGLLLLDQPGDSQFWGYVWLFAVAGWFLIRSFIDQFMVRRPMLEPNLSPGGLVFIAVSLFVFLMVNVVTKQPNLDDLEGPRALDALLQGQAPEEEQDLVRHGPGFPWLFLIPSITTKTLSRTHAVAPHELGPHIVQAATARTITICAHLAVVIGIILIGLWHFENVRTGVAAATLYLLLPYTAQVTGKVDHVVPAALLVWAIAAYRRPLIAGVLVGLVTGAIYYPFFLLPLWIGFYWHRGLVRFSAGFLSMILLLVGSLALTSENAAHFMAQLKMMFGWIRADTPGLRGFWLFYNSSLPYRMPVLAAYAAMCACFALWPPHKNLGTLLSCSAAVMLGTQFLHVKEGGAYIAWYLPLLLLTIFRPNLENRVALATLGESWFGRRRLALGRRAA